MPKINPDTAPRRKAEWVHFCQSDPLMPDTPLELWLRPLDPLQLEAADEFADELARMYLTGGWRDDDGKPQKEPIPLHAVGGEPVELSREAITIAARIERMQGIRRPAGGAITADAAGHPVPEDRYTAEELLRVAPCVPDAWYGLVACYIRLLGGQEGWQKKDATAPTA